MKLAASQRLALTLISALLFATTSTAQTPGLVFQPGFHQGLRWSVTTTGRTTYRMKVPVGRPGSRLRFAFRAGEGSLTLHAASVALAGSGGALASAPVPLSFQGSRTVTLAAGARRLSDPVAFPVAFGTELYISFDVEGSLAAGAIMTFPDSFKYSGGQADAPNPSGATPWMRAIGLDTIDVEAPATRAFVALGDSITEGYISGDVWDYVSRNDDYRNAWGTVAQRQLQLPVANAAVSNQGVNDAIAHLDTEVFTLSGITDCLVLIGTNDLPFFTAPELQERMGTLFSRLRPWCRVWAGTMLPKERTREGDLATVNARRRAVNDWMRTQANVTGVIDFAAVTASPTNPDVFRPGLNEDGVHTTLLGQSLMGQEAARVLAEPGPSVFNEVDADRVLSVARQQSERTASVMPATQYPKATRADGTWTTVPNTSPTGWTQGFFPGNLWMLHQAGGETTWRTRADVWTRNLELQKTNTQTHDLGFKFMPTFGLAYQLTGDPYYRSVALTAARSLATRFNPTVGIIDCCDWNSDWEVPLVVDTMMNLELLFWASRNGGEAAWNTMALSHALKTLTDMVRPDGGTYHVVDYDSEGRIRFRGTFQGYSDSSTWARGQAWAIYGFTMAYRYTRDARMLQAAQKVTDYYLSRLPADGIPLWDFDAPAGQQKKDSSAAAIVASALLELSEFVTAPADKARYRGAALTMLETLASPAYLTSGTSTYALLNHGVGHLPAGQEVDVGLIYGDYYLLEAVLRFKRLATSRAVSMGATWRYDDRGVDPGSQWMTPGFNDSAWRQGPAQLGYGDGDEATLLTRTPTSQPSVYFRRHVTLTGPVTQAALRVLHDDGVAVWINGTLAFSKYVANGTAHGAYASAASLDNEVSSTPLSPSLFREGDNVIAVMVKQAGASSSDTSFDFELTATTVPAAAAPRVTLVSPNGGESLRPGNVQAITWTSSGQVSNVRLELSPDNGTTWQTITGSTPNTGQYAWTVPAVSTRLARIRVSDAANPSISDLSDAVFSILTETVITPIVFGSSWRFDDRGVDPGAQWRARDFDDSSWRMGPGQLGYGDGDEATVMRRTSPAQPSVYFRKKVSLSGTVTRAELRVLHDDGVAVWVNGTLVFSRYVDNGTSHAAYASSSSADNAVSTAVLPSAAFVSGENTIAVMVKQSSSTSSDLSFDLALTLSVEGGGPPPTEETIVPIPLGSVWKYDDAGVDRGTAWLALGYDDTAWRSGPAQLGYGDGDEATVLRSSPRAPSYYFRRRFRVEGQVTQAQLRALFDDGVAVWVNGTLVLSRNMGNGTAFSAYASAGSEDNEVANATLPLTPNPFVQGDNVVTVMLKQASATSSDASFDLSLTLTIRR